MKANLPRGAHVIYIQDQVLIGSFGYKSRHGVVIGTALVLFLENVLLSHSRVAFCLYFKIRLVHNLSYRNEFDL